MQTFLLSAPKNHTLSAMSGSSFTNEYTHIPAGTEFSIKLIRAIPHDKYMSRSGGEGDIYLSNTAVADAVRTAQKKVEVVFLELQILYERIEFEPGVNVFKPGSSFRYTFDTPHTALSSLSPATRYTTNTFLLPKNVNLLYFCFLYQHQLYPGKGFCFRIPKSCLLLR